MSVKTISYSENSDGWTSFWSYEPDWMIHINNLMYSFKNGNLYLHNDETVSYNRTVFYGVPYGCMVRTIFNDDPLSVKMYKAISLDGTDKWRTSLETDLQVGGIDESWFIEKEGNYFSFIRNYDLITSNPSSITNISQIDGKSIYIQGIGKTAASAVLNHVSILGQGIDTQPNINDGDYIYAMPNSISNPSQLSGVMSYIGRAIDFVPGTMFSYGVLNFQTNISVSAGMNLVCVKNTLSESYGIRGYFMDITLSNNNLEFIELFDISASVFKSFP